MQLRCVWWRTFIHKSSSRLRRWSHYVKNDADVDVYIYMPTIQNIITHIINSDKRKWRILCFSGSILFHFLSCTLPSVSEGIDVGASETFLIRHQWSLCIGAAHHGVNCFFSLRCHWTFPSTPASHFAYAIFSPVPWLVVSLANRKKSSLHFVECHFYRRWMWMSTC